MNAGVGDLNRTILSKLSMKIDVLTGISTSKRKEKRLGCALIYLSWNLYERRNVKETEKRGGERSTLFRNCSMDFSSRSLTIKRSRADVSLGKLRITCFSIKYTETRLLGNTESTCGEGWRKINREIRVCSLIANFKEAAFDRLNLILWNESNFQIWLRALNLILFHSVW